ncbi:hypothetical protein Celaphus_00010203, partial [Cervus elaphus hippelaphus]
LEDCPGSHITEQQNQRSAAAGALQISAHFLTSFVKTVRGLGQRQKLAGRNAFGCHAQSWTEPGAGITTNDPETSLALEHQKATNGAKRAVVLEGRRTHTKFHDEWDALNIKTTIKTKAVGEVTILNILTNCSNEQR